MKLSRIAWHYIKGWLMLDMGVIMLEWFLLIVEPESISRAVTLARSAKILRLSRFLRLVRFVRLFKFSSRVSYIHAGSFQLQALPTAMGIMRSLVYILVASHYIACAWYLVGGRYKRTWIDMFDEDHHGVPYRYATSLHWSITQFTPASAEVQPRNTLERGFAILVIVLGMVAFSCFISSITQAMGNFQRLRAEELQRTANMRQFFLENQVSFDVGARITRFLQEAATHEKQRHRLHENDLPQLQLLPDSLRSELHLEMYKPILYSHGFFCVAMEADSSCLEEICHHAGSPVNVRHHKDLFEADSEAHSAFYLTSGTGMYTLKYTKETAKVSECQWLVEAALWLQWRHQGTVYAKTSLQGVRLDSAKFRRPGGSPRGVRFICMKYAQEYLRLLEAHDSNTQAFMAELGFDADVLDAMVQTICFAQEEETRSRSNELSRISHGSIANAMHELGGRVHHLRSSSSRVFG
ncbi:unnamed protein product [Prorocentrum cordatum]|uniref:Ion transport domain-containing protein n=1 Tax=Prorocentrum cordatum TaxID=2364126 RepID=A0ABN9TQ62_9DINO|nr:unnamed protein product [Polarella glacialis]